MKRSTRILITMFFLSSVVTAAAADPPVLQGPAFLPGDGGADSASGNQEEVAIAAGGGGFLTVWTDMRTAAFDFQGHDQSGHDVYAARLDAAGNLIDTSPMILSQAEGSQKDPEVAWNGQNWLVVWENQTLTQPGSSPPKKIFGARVAPDGTVLDSPFEIYQAPGFAGTMIAMAVVANGSDWLVVGQADSGGALEGVRVAADGTVLDAVPVELAPATYFLYYNVSVHVAKGEYLVVHPGEGPTFEARRFSADLSPIAAPFSVPADEPRIASNGVDYFITWDPPGPTLFGSRMTVDGTLLDPAGISLMESFWDPSPQTSVKWDGTHWWILHSLPYPEGGLHVARVSPDGTVLDSPPIPLFDFADEQFVGPFEFTAGSSGGAQLVWADQDCNCADEWDTSLRPWDIHGVHISAAAQVGTEEVLSCAKSAQTLPRLTAGSDQFLAVFRSEKGDVKRILAQRLDSQGNAIDAEPIEIASSPYVDNPDVAWNGSVYMIVWDEFYYCVGGDPPPCGSFVQAVRMLPDGTVIDAQPIHALEANHAAVGALGDDFLVVGRDNHIFHEHEVIPLGVRVDGATGALLDPVPLVIGWSFAMEPRVTTFGDKWLVVWEQRGSHDQSWGVSRYNLVSADGTVQYDKFQTPAACGGATPEVAVSGAGALVVCREKAWGHFLADINGGLIRPDETTFHFLISGAVEEQRNPAVTWTGTEFLAVWEDKRNGADFFDERTDLYGARVDMYGQLLDPDGFPVANSSIPEQHPVMVYGGSDVLLAASIFNEAETNFRLGVYHTPGVINDPPDVSFSESVAGGCSPLEVSFTDQSVGDVSSWFWNFGDGGTSFAQNPTHVYAEPGTYTVLLTAAGDSGPASDVKFDLVTVAQGTVADFWTPVTSGCAPLDVNFYNTTLGDQTGWVWMFGDDTVSTGQIATHTYEFPGNYTVMMTADGACGPDTKTRAEYIQIDRMCPVQDGAVEDFPVEGNVTNTYLQTHADNSTSTYQSIEEISAPVPGGGTTWQLEHRWRFEATGGTAGMTFYVNFYIYYEALEGFRFEYSQDNVNFTPILTIDSVWSSQHVVPLPPGLTGTVWIRLIDDNRTTTDTRRDWTAVYGMAIETGVPVPTHPVPATMGLTFSENDSMEWMPAASATRYDIMWGNLADLSANGTVGDAQCGWEDHSGTTLIESSTPPPGVGYYYVIRGDAQGLEAGTLDNVPGLSTPEGRDQEVGTSGGYSCADMP